MVKQSVAERRNGIRAKRVMSIQYRLIKTKTKNREQNWYLSTTQDMSISGLSFLSEKSFSTDDVLELKVVMSGVLDIFNGTAKVVRCERNPGAAYCFVGVKFIASNAAARSSSSGRNRISARFKKK